MPENITVRQLLDSKESKIHSIAPDATVFDALKILSEAKIGALPVMADGELVGMFTERDYARKIILEGKSSKDTKISDVMTEIVSSVTADKTVKECMALMNKNRFRHLPVMEGDKLIGIISIGDVVRAVLMSLL